MAFATSAPRLVAKQSVVAILFLCFLAVRATNLYVACTVGTATSGACTGTGTAACSKLAVALDVAVAGDVIHVSDGPCAEHDVQVPTAVTITGPSADAPVVVDCTGGRCFMLTASGPGVTTLKYLRLTNGYASNSRGGCVFAQTSTMLDHVDMIGCTANSGGAFLAEAATTTSTFVVMGGTYSRNQARDGDGSAISSVYPINITGVTFTDNYASCRGAVVLAAEEGLNLIQGCTFRNNSASECGGAVLLCQPSGATKVIDSTFTSCSGGFEAGAIMVASVADLEIRGSDFTTCTAGAGGALVIQNGGVDTGVFNIIDSNFIGNSALLAGAYYHGGSAASMLNLTNVVFQGNMGGPSGLLVAAPQTYVTLTKGRFVNNVVIVSEAPFGAFGLLQMAAATVTDVYFGGNVGLLYGAALVLYTTPGPLTLRNGVFENNFANRSALLPQNFGAGAALIAAGGEALIADCIFRSNTADVAGAVLVESYYGDDESFATLRNCTFESNTASLAGALLMGYGNMRLEDAVNFFNNVALNGTGLPVVLVKDGTGGALITADPGLLVVTDDTVVNFTGNSAPHGSGGAWYNGFTCPLNISASAKFIFEKNYASVDGGALFTIGSVTMNDAIFRDNTAQGNGAAIAGVAGVNYDVSAKVAQVTLVRPVLAGNVAINGASIFNRTSAAPGNSTALSLIDVVTMCGNSVPLVDITIAPVMLDGVNRTADLPQCLGGCTNPGPCGEASAGMCDFSVGVCVCSAFGYDGLCYNAPGAPTGLVLTPTATSVNVAWTAPNSVATITNYTVERSSPDATNFAFLATTTTPTLLDTTNIASSTNYYYRVSACNLVSCGPVSSAASTTTLEAPSGTGPAAIVAPVADAPASDNAAVIGGAVGGSIGGLLLIAIIIFVIYRTRRRQDPHAAHKDIAKSESASGSAQASVSRASGSASGSASASKAGSASGSASGSNSASA